MRLRRILMFSTHASSAWRKRHGIAGSVLIAALAGMCCVPAALAQTDHFRVLYQYPNPTDGGGPSARLVRDDQGNLYGVGGGGSANDGIVFELSPSGQETVLYTFNGTDGSRPEGGLVRDSAGNLYGTTPEGGSKGYGVVFRLTPAGDYTVLHDFHGAPDGASPWGDLLLDAAGNLYGTTAAGGQGCSNPYGASGCGTVFKITAAGKESIVYRFAGAPDGSGPSAGLIADQDGNLYGTTEDGGNLVEGDTFGTVYRVTPDGQETVLYRFNGESAGDGQNPRSTLVMDDEGNLYGTTLSGGPNSFGTVFEVSPTGVESILHSFPASADDGINPFAGLVRDRNGNLYGTTNVGGAENTGCAGSGCGVVFQLAPGNAETIVHSFTDTGDDGCLPVTALTEGPGGTLYGTSEFCGTTGNGTIFAIHFSD
jgi:uncharacterized repeat protein (TIGR03803 family)